MQNWINFKGDVSWIITPSRKKFNLPELNSSQVLSSCTNCYGYWSAYANAEILAHYQAYALA